MPNAPEQGIEPIDQLQATLGRRIDIVLWYQHWDGWGAEFHPEWVSNVTDPGRIPLLTWEPWSSSLRSIADGTFDEYVYRWASELKALGQVVYLRPMHEMNGNWYPWSGSVNGNTAADYVAAWRHIHTIFENAGAVNIRWVWSPYALDVPATSDNSFERYYPGSQYVDVLALDGYNWGGDMPQYGGWRSFDAIFAEAYRRIAGLGPQPIWIAETASDAAGGDKAAWVRDMFARAVQFPRIEAIVWFNVDKERDWRATSSPDVAAAFSSGR
jgi:beta-mannanase